MRPIAAGAELSREEGRASGRYSLMLRPRHSKDKSESPWAPREPGPAALPIRTVYPVQFLSN